MANRVPNINIPASITKKNKFMFQQDTVSTATFLSSQPDTYLWTIPFQDVKIKLDSFTRCAPLNLPTFGRVTVSHRAFFVKFKQICEGWNEAYTRSLKIPGKVLGTNNWPAWANTGVLNFTNSTLINTFTTAANGLTTTGSPLSGDIVITDSLQVPMQQTFYTLTEKGRVFYKIINGLGYKLVPDKSSGMSWNALPLLAYTKIMADYYYPSNWKNNTIYTKVINILKASQQATSAAELTLGQTELVALADFFLVCNGYDQDYFVSSYVNDVVQNDNPYPTNALPTDYTGQKVNLNASDSPTLQNGTNHSFTQQGLDLLQRVTQYLKINSLAGADAFNRLYAMFGYKSENERSIHFGNDEYLLQIGDIQSTADTTASGGASIGSYAGKGVGGTKDAYFTYKCDGDCGIIIVVKTITPHIGYYQGWDRHNTQLNILDFWHPLFDAIGDQDIAKGELFAEPDVNANPAYLTNANLISVFGKIPRFAHYKVGHDLCIGDFMLGTRNTGMNAWHLMRDINSGRFTQIPSTSLGFAAADDAVQYLRIFQNNGSANTYEPFNCVSNYTIETYAPMRKLWDDTCLDQLEHQGNDKNEFQPGGSELY